MFLSERRDVRTPGSAPYARSSGGIAQASVSLAAVHARSSVLAELGTQISRLDHEIEALIQSSSEFSRNYQLLTSIIGVGPVSGYELIIKTENLRKLDTAKKCSAYAGIAPYPKESGKMKYGHRIQKDPRHVVISDTCKC